MGDPAELSKQERSETLIDALQIYNSYVNDVGHPFARQLKKLTGDDKNDLEMLILRLSQEVIRLSGLVGR